MARPARYHLLPFSEKQRGWLGGVARREVRRCTTCGIACLEHQLEAHRERRCSGVPVVPLALMRR